MAHTNSTKPRARTTSTSTGTHPRPLPTEVYTQRAEMTAAWARVDQRIQDMIGKALGYARKLRPGRVTPSARPELFYVAFGPETERAVGFAGTGLVELQVEVDLSGLTSETVLAGALPTKLRFRPTSYSLNGGVDDAEKLGTALLEAVHFARTLSALIEPELAEGAGPHRHAVVTP